MVALYQGDVTSRTAGALLEPTAREFTRELVAGVEHDREWLDELIERYAQGWTLDRIAPVERNILRVALFELLRREDDTAVLDLIAAAQRSAQPV